jgi:hypothetical protein
MKKYGIVALVLLSFTGLALAFSPSVTNVNEASSKDVHDTYEACTGSSPSNFTKYDCACTTDYLTLLAHTTINAGVVSACNTFATNNASNTSFYTTLTPYSLDNHNAIAIDKLYNDSFTSWTFAYPSAPLAKRQAAASCVADNYRAGGNPFIFNRACGASAGLYTGP